jgi:uncharacterized protein (TIGR03437 family)
VLVPFRTFLVFSCLCFSLSAQITPGGGAPSDAIGNDFIHGYFRNGFYNLVSNPLANVAKYGSTGYIQEFNDVAKDAKLALILPSVSVSGTENAVLQMINPLYGYYSTVGVNTAGYPTIDTQNCPGIANCQYQLFSLSYALFYWAAGNPNGNGFSVSGTIYTKWAALGGVSGALGPGYNAQAAVTSPAKTTANVQQFSTGMVASLTSGINSGSTFAVVEPGYDLYLSAGGPAGLLGLPTGDDVTLASGLHRQLFEGGRIEYQPGSAPNLLLAITQINLFPLGPISLSYGQTQNVSVRLFDSQGIEAFGRTISWTTSNGRVATVAASGYNAVINAVGSGTANITATVEGKVSTPIVVTVISPCCQIGEGAPTSAMQQAFQNAVIRNGVTVLLPAASPVTRVSTGYAQDLYSPDKSIHYLVTLSDTSSTAFVVSGSVLSSYLQYGGLTGSLGYPASDLSAGGTQLFQNGALAANPVQLVAGAVLQKWAALKYETGPAGLPVAARIAFTSQSAYTGYSQAFAGGVIYGISNGILTGQGYLVSGPILTRYSALAGPAGVLGVPLIDQFTANGVARQNFENGYIDLQPGSSTAVEHLQPRTPAISTNPTSALAGSRLHVRISGFSNGASLRVAQSGQPDFLVTTANGTYDWDLYIAPGTAAGTVTIKATDTSSASVTATGSYSVRSLADAKPTIVKSLGDNQTGSPGATLAVPLTVTISDGAGAPISGTAVSFSASPGASLSAATVTSDSNGRASVSMRLPASAGVSAVTAQALGQIAIFNAQATGSAALANFPQFLATSPAGAQVAAAASMLRYYQNRGLMPSANGLADPVALDTFLKSLPDGYLNKVQLVNLWRLTRFTGGNVTVSIESPDLGTVRSLVAAGDPVLIGMSLTQDKTPSGGATVVATGVASDGSVMVLDPNSYFGRTSLSDYLNGFSLSGHAFQGTVLSAVRLVPLAPSPSGFLLDAVSQPLNAFPALNATGAGGACSAPLLIQDPYYAGAVPPASILASRFVYCDGVLPAYQFAVGGSSPYQAAVIDLASGGATTDLSGSAAAGYQAVRTSGLLTIAAPTVAFTADAILNAASFQPGISPGSLISIFGAGLSGDASATTAVIGGQPAAIVLATPFQLNVQVSPAAPAGSSTVQVTSPFGTKSQPVSIQAVSPGIFTLGTASDGTSALGAVVNQNGSINGSSAPAARGTVITIYSTGLGVTTPSGNLSVTAAKVTALLAGAELPSSFAGLTPGFIGLYQVNLPIPAATAPGLLPLELKIGSITSNSVAVVVQ